MKADLLITNIGQLVTCASGTAPNRGSEMRELGLLRDAAVAFADGEIAAVGKSAEILDNFTALETVDAYGKVVCPGFVDPHTHIVYSGDRLSEFELKIGGADYLEILGAGGGIVSTVRATRTASFDQLVDEGRKRLDRMLLCGTTTAEVKTGYGLNTETELKMLRVIERLDKIHAVTLVPTFLAAHTVPPEFKGDPDGYVDLICSRMLPAAWHWYSESHFIGNGIPFFVDVFCERNAFSPDQARRVFDAAALLGFKLKAHVDQFTNMGGSQLAIQAGAVSIDHLDAISDEEIVSLANSKTIGIVIPTENFSGGKTRFANARKMIDSGCGVALSTDFNPGSAPCPAMPMAMAIACRYQRLLPSEALLASTVNAAFGIGLGDSVGSIEVGKKADLLIVDCMDYRQLAYEFGGNLISEIFKAGVRIRK